MNKTANLFLERWRGKFGRAMDDRAVQAHLKISGLLDSTTIENFDEKTTKLEEFIGLSGKEHLKDPTRYISPMKEERVRVDDYAQGRSVLYAEEAKGDEKLKAFREEVLAGKLLHKERVKDWIERKAKEDGQPSRWLQIPLSSGHQIVLNKQATALTVEPSVSGPFVSWQSKYLDCGTPGSSYQETVPVRYGGVLDRLRVLSERLARRYPWQLAQATNFILTGLIPLVPSHRSSFDPNTARFTIEVDISVTPRQLADFFRRSKRECLKSHRTKVLSQKHLSLAVFAPHLSEESDWGESFRLWNKTNQQWRYQNLALFKRDSLVARKRLESPFSMDAYLRGLELRPPKDTKTTRRKKP